AKFDATGFLPAMKAMAAMGAIAFVVVEAIYRFRSPAAYLEGLGMVNADHSANYLTYLAGQMAPNFASYFTAAYLLKEPLAAIGLAVVGVVLILRRKEFAARDKWFLLLPPVALFLLHMWKADNLGIRYIIPCLPFAHLAGGIALASLFG